MQILFQPFHTWPRVKKIGEIYTLHVFPTQHFHKNVGNTSNHWKEDDNPDPHGLAPVPDTMDHTNGLEGDSYVVNVVYRV